MCLSAENATSLSVLQFLSRDGTTGWVLRWHELMNQPSDSTAANHAHPLLNLGLKMIYTNLYTIIYSREYTSCHYPQNRQGVPGFPDATTMAFVHHFSKSLVTVFPPTWCVTLFNVSSTSEVSQNPRVKYYMSI